MKNASQEFSVGNNNIGYVSSSFEERFSEKEFQESSAAPKYQKTLRPMTDAEIESELKPGICTLGDVLAFIKNPPEQAKDGYYNLFYFPECVVDVDWDSFDRSWYVGTWRRDDSKWYVVRRVFFPATDLPSGTAKLPDILEINGEKYKKI